MKSFGRSSLLLSLFFSSLAHAAAFQFYELGTPIIATAGVGQASTAQDASTAYFNPAGMTQLPDTEVLLGTQMMLPYTNFSANSATTITGNNGGNAGSLVPGATGYFVYSYSPQLKFGASLTTPYGGALNYDNHWVGRYSVQQMMLYTINLNPAVAYQINHWAAIGAGIAIEYANLYQTVAIPVTSDVDGQATLKLDNVAPGFNIGVLLTPYHATKIGIAYRSQIVHHLNGNANFVNISSTPSAASTLVTPANIIASLSQALTHQFTLLGELGWADWSSMRNNIISIDGYNAVIPENWRNTYRLGLAGQYQFNPALLLQAGASYDSSPTTASHRSPALPMDRQVRIGLGLEYALLKSVLLGLSYEYINLGHASINNASYAGMLAGSYSRNFANVIQASVNVGF